MTISTITELLALLLLQQGKTLEKNGSRKGQWIHAAHKPTIPFPTLE
jgi:hypothetical protein